MYLTITTPEPPAPEGPVPGGLGYGPPLEPAPPPPPVFAEPFVPPLFGAFELGVLPIIAVIVRDRNINELQQVRVGGECTMDTALEYYKDMAVHFIDHEAFFLYKEKYVEYLGRMLEFPVTKEGIDNFITVDANHKYVFPCKEHWLDKEIRRGRQPFTQRPKE